MKVLVVTSCTGEKKFSPENQLVQDDFRDEKKLKAREKELKEFALPAGEMYTGMQHLRLMEGLALLRGEGATSDRRQPTCRVSDVACRPPDAACRTSPVACRVPATFDLAIVSAGYGLIAEDRKIVPYEVTFNTMKNPEIDQWAAERHIHDDLVALLPGYDLVFVLLGDKYLRACDFRQATFDAATGDRRQATCRVSDAACRPPDACRALDAAGRPEMIFFAAGTSRKYLPQGARVIELSNADAKSFGYGLVGLKGYLFKLLAQDVVEGRLDLRQATCDAATGDRRQPTCRKSDVACRPRPCRPSPVACPTSASPTFDAIVKALDAHRKKAPRQVQPLLFELPPPDSGRKFVA